MSPDSFSTATSQCIASQWQTAGTYSWLLYLGNTGRLGFECSADGTTVVAKTSNVQPTQPYVQAAYCCAAGGTTVNGVALTQGQIAFFQSPDGVAWTQMGTIQSTGLSPLFATSAPIQVGVEANVGQPFTGTITNVTIADGATTIANLNNSAPWFGYSGTPGYFADGEGNVWNTTGTGVTWRFISPAPPASAQHVQTVTANGTFAVPAGVTTMKVIAVGGGGGGGGSGCAALTGGVTGQGSAGGGGAGCVVEQWIGVTPGQTLTHTIGTGGSGGAGGAASTGATGNTGAVGAVGAQTTVTGTGVSIIAYGGGFAVYSGANTTTGGGGGFPGVQSIYTSATAVGVIGGGGYGVSTIRRSSPPWPQGPSGGQAGAFATATNGGSGGVAGPFGAQWAAVSGAGGDAPTTSGLNGADAVANSGCGGGGGGAGAPGGAGGNGGAGGSGYVVYTWIA
jgi:hypothetical protein